MWSTRTPQAARGRPPQTDAQSGTTSPAGGMYVCSSECAHRWGEGGATMAPVLPRPAPPLTQGTPPCPSSHP
eukprot:4384975-Pyramimonas_sp.AAC.1